MSKIRAQVITRKQSDLGVDHIVNTLYLDDFGAGVTDGPRYQSLANDIRTAFGLRASTPIGYGVEVKLYDMADAEPRPIKATAVWMSSPSASASEGPREVALCLSFFSERNLPRFRGRLYIGPFGSAGARPSVDTRNELVALAGRIGNVGGVDVDWQLFSPTRNAYSKVTAGWVDDEWDTVRSRGRKPTTRTTFKTQE